ncbi:MAG TPA: ATP phosphoribosyltransferase regulatory subunit [Gemmatimonadales bacterium]|nr:ATP phosphoribosyltransferase regulatory subunit [Gemmatimonadales bacterium]
MRGIEAVQAALAKVAGGADAGEPLAEAVSALGAMGLTEFVQVDLTIVRGLAYYTGIVFELFDTGKGLRAICGGGRYDGLLKALADVDLPALGFGMGDVVLAELLRERRATVQTRPPLDAFLVAVSGEDVAPVLKLAHDLRERGVAVEYGLRPAAIRKQLELAAARGAPRAVIVGPDERRAGAAVVRDLKTGTEAKVPLATLVDGFFR